MSNVTPQKAWNSPPTKDGGNKGRQANMGKEPVSPTRCTVLIDGTACNRYPAWGDPKERKNPTKRCEYHRTQYEGRDLTEAQKGSLERGA